MVFIIVIEEPLPSFYEESWDLAQIKNVRLSLDIIVGATLLDGRAGKYYSDIFTEPYVLYKPSPGTKQLHTWVICEF